MQWDEGEEACPSMSLTAAMDAAAREVSARTVSVTSVFTTGLETPIFRGLQINWKNWLRSGAWLTKLRS